MGRIAFNQKDESAKVYHTAHGVTADSEGGIYRRSWKRVAPRPYDLGATLVSDANTFLTTKSVRICAFW